MDQRTSTLNPNLLFEKMRYPRPMPQNVTRQRPRQKTQQDIPRFRPGDGKPMDKLRDFLTEAKWSKGAYARDARGNEVRFDSPLARKFCIMGALMYLYTGEKYLMAQDRVASLVRVLHKKRIKDFNDTASWQEVSSLLRAIDV